jgi:8-oxo-dGTP pyrophosphatase MutT (NUDIX family)
LLDFDPLRPAVLPRDASTVVVIRNADRGVEVFCVQRHARSKFLGGAVVFPGGKLDASDAAPIWNELATDPHPRAIELVGAAGDKDAAPIASSRALAVAVAVAACRETLEEGAILPVRGGALTDADVTSMSADLRAGRKGLADALAERGLKLAIDELIPWARWITPEAEARRFDARFFLLALPEGQVGRHDEHETTMSFWAPPQEVLDRFFRGLIFLAPPTTRTLELLASAGDVEGAKAIAARQSLRSICPRFMAGAEGGAPYLALPGDPSHEVRERRVEGSTRFELRDGMFLSAKGFDKGEAEAGGAA